MIIINQCIARLRRTLVERGFLQRHGGKYQRMR
ncbi:MULTISPECIES: DUF2087 domain-containing protein [unclassified Bartonella]